ncbi:MAG: type II toxin-antitoxin system Phd/YefM family antitoxin [Caldilineales bacterium]
MLRTLEAVIDEQGAVRLLEPVKLAESRRALVTILEDAPEIGAALRPFGLSAGQFIVPDDFDAPLPDEMVALFEAA